MIGPIELDDVAERDAIARELAHATAFTMTRWVALDAPQGAAEITTWARFADDLYIRATEPHRPDGWAPTSYVGDYRETKRVKLVHAVAIDVDGGTLSPDAAAEMCVGGLAIVYTTRRSTVAQPRFRVIVSTARPLNRDEHAIVSRRHAERFAAAGAKVDTAASCDASRFWFWPSVGADGARGRVLEVMP